MIDVAVVEVLQRDADGEIEVLARIHLSETGAAVIVPTQLANLQMIENILDRAGVVDRIGRPIARSDGERYLHALPQSLRGSRLWAEVVGGEDGVT